MATHKILISPGYGGGWTTWNPDIEGKGLTEFALTYQPLIDFLESGGDKDSSEFRAILDKFKEEVEDKFEEPFYLGGAGDLEVATVDGPFYIEEYDGNEALITTDQLIDLG